jgi:hypothetical protein
MTKKKASVDFLAGLKTMEHDTVRRHPVSRPVPAPLAVTPKEPAAAVPPTQQPSRKGKVAITHWVDPAVRKQLARLSIDHDSSQAALVAEALNLLFEKYGQPPIAAPLSETSPVMEPAI